MATYWLTGPDGTYVQVEGAAHRDMLLDLGWSESDEPDRNGRVWMRHSETRAYVHFVAESLEGWLAKGWEFAAPPIRHTEQGLEALVPAPLDYVEPQPEKAEKSVTENAPEVTPVKSGKREP